MMPIFSWATSPKEVVPVKIFTFGPYKYFIYRLRKSGMLYLTRGLFIPILIPEKRIFHETCHR